MRRSTRLKKLRPSSSEESFFDPPAPKFFGRDNSTSDEESATEYQSRGTSNRASEIVFPDSTDTERDEDDPEDSDGQEGDESNIGCEAESTNNSSIKADTQGDGGTQSSERNEDLDADGNTQDTGSRRYKYRSSYQAYPILKEFYEPVIVNGKKVASTCKLCDSKITHHSNERHFDHLTVRCKSINDESRNRLLQVWHRSTASGNTNETKYALLLTKIIIKHNLPLRLADCEMFREILRLSPPLVPISRQRISAFYIPRVSDLIAEKFMKETAQGSDYVLSIEFDHWTDALHRSLLAVLATRNDGAKFLIEVEDVSAVGNFAESIVSTLNHVLDRFESSKINAIVSDAASACTKARADFFKQDKYKHIIQQRCFAHLLNLIGKDVSEHPECQDILKKASQVVAAINGDAKVMAEFAKAGQRRCARYVKTRWYSMVTMLENLIDCQDAAIEALTKVMNESRIQTNIERVETSRTLQSDLFGPNLNILVSIFRPLANCIAVAEDEESRLGDAMKALLEFVKSLFDCDWEVEFVLPTIMAFLNHFNATKLNEDGLGIMLAAYLLDPRNSMNYVTEEGAKLVLKTLYDLALTMKYTLKQVGSSLGMEMKAYYTRTGFFSAKVEPNQSAEMWWRAQPNFGLLKFLALRVVTLRSSSANIERLFSVLKVIQGPNRLRFALRSLTSIARTKIANRLAEDLADIREDDTFEFYQQQGDESIRRESSSSQQTKRRSFSVDLESGLEAFERNLQSSTLGALDTDNDSMRSESCYQDVIINLQRPRNPHHLTKKFQDHPFVKASYKEFFKIFDFSILNDPQPEEQELEAAGDDARFGITRVLNIFSEVFRKKK